MTRLRDAKPEQLLQLSEVAIDQATATGDTLTLESMARELDSAAAYETAYILMFVVALGPLLVALTVAIGFVPWYQGNRRSD